MKTMIESSTHEESCGIAANCCRVAKRHGLITTGALAQVGGFNVQLDGLRVVGCAER
jgi:hypothetical protein